MYIKGCENTNNDHFDKNAYREGWKRIFGNKHEDGVVKFPSGKGIYDDATGQWVDSEKYRASKGEWKATPLMLTDNPYAVEIIKGNKDGSVEKRFEHKKIRIGKV